MSKEEFFKNPYEFCCLNPDKVEVEWIAEAWNLHEFRDNVTYTLSRSVSKVGDFGLAAEIWLQVLPRILTCEQVRDLYIEIRDESQRFEFEWRSDFETAFPDCRGLLPDSQDRDVVWEALIEAVQTGYGQGFESILELLEDIPNPIDLITSPYHNGKSLLDLARENRRQLMVTMLEEALERLREKEE